MKVIMSIFMIPILVIGLGLAVYNTSSNVVERSTTKIEALEMQEFNNQISEYTGAQKSDYQIMTLILIVESSNETNEEHQIIVKTEGEGFTEEATFVTGTKSSEELSKIMQGLKVTYQYNVDVKYGTDGYIKEISIY